MIPQDLFDDDNLPTANARIPPTSRIVIPRDTNEPDDLDQTPLTFGKHVGLTPEQVAKKDPGWLVWAKQNVTNKLVCSDALYRDCQK